MVWNCLFRSAALSTHRLVTLIDAGIIVQEVAERIGREARSRGIKARVMALDAYNVHNLPAEQLAVFVVATAGQVGAGSSITNYPSVCRLGGCNIHFPMYASEVLVLQATSV